MSLAKKVAILYQIYERATRTKREKVHRDAVEVFGWMADEMRDEADAAGLKGVRLEIWELKEALERYHQQFNKDNKNT